MPRQIALLICILFIVWLFYRDRKIRPMTSIALWIPFLWVIILGTRPISMWFGIEYVQVDSLDDYLEGSPFDRNVLLGLIIAGVTVVIRRSQKCLDLLKENRFFLLFFIFCGISCFWSDYAFVSFKRYTKDIGTLVMVLIVLTETEPIQALRAVFARYSYLVLLISVVFIKYFPEFGRVYNRWTGEPVYCGIATEKNIFGQFVFICGLFIIWDLIEILIKQNAVNKKADVFNRFILLGLVIWLLYMASSATAIFCMSFGVIILIFMQTSLYKRQIQNLGTWIIAFLLLVIVIYSISGLLEFFTDILGRDTTLTGRTEIWNELLAQPINPWLGVGYQSFWLTPTAARMTERFYFTLNQAHNGFLEVYIQTGLVSLSLLIAAIIAGSKQIKIGLLRNDNLAQLIFPFFIITLISNWTEASINKFTLVWFILMIAIMYNPNLGYSNFKSDLSHKL